MAVKSNDMVNGQPVGAKSAAAEEEAKQLKQKRLQLEALQGMLNLGQIEQAAEQVGQPEPVRYEPEVRYEPRRQEVAQPRGNGWAAYSWPVRICMGLLLLALGFPGWLVGGAASVEGLVLIFNIILGFLHTTWTVPRIAGDLLLVAVPLVAIPFSVVEVSLRPERPYFTKIFFAVIIGALAAHSLDLGTTYLAVTDVQAGAWEIQTWARDQVWPAALYSLAITYVPEILILQALAAFGIKTFLSVVLFRLRRLFTRS